MEFKAFLIKYAEIGIKGKNRYLFEDMLVSRINSALKRIEGKFEVFKASGRIYVRALSDYDFDEAVEALQHVFGIVGICPLVQLPLEDFESLKRDVVQFVGGSYPDQNFSFKCMARRANKSYPLDTNALNAQLGEAILDAFPGTRVDVHEPEVYINVEIREVINLYSRIIPGPGGMPVGCNGRAMLLLSGGIDSPVAGYMVSKRGVELHATYFHAPPYTSERAKQKVIDLAKIISAYTGPITLHVVNFTDLQLYIYETCPHEELTILMRRYMMRIAETLAERNNCLALITGESIGQVASQTVQSLNATNEVCKLPVFRPVIAFDKQDIVDIAERIGTFETSIQPYEDCCTIFVAKHPVTKPNVNIIRRSEEKLVRAEELVKQALETEEIIRI